MRRVWLLPLVASGSLALAAGCQRGAPPRARPPVPVVVEPAAARPVERTVDAIGTATPLHTVEVRAQVTGVLESIGFRDGEEVREGQVLFQLDARPMRAALDQARAKLAQDSAQLANARVEARRYAGLVPNGIVSRQEYDARVAQANAMTAAVQADRAAIESARVSLGYTTIRSPLDGVAGAHRVDPGNLVRAGDATPLVTVRQIAPIDVAFAVPAGELDVRQAGAAALEVRARPPGAAAPLVGHVRFIDSAIDPATGTTQVKATFANDDSVLAPGQFVPVTLVLGTVPDAVVVAARAVQPGQGGDHVFVVGDDDHAQLRPVVRGARAGDRIAVEGVRAGERVVVDGLLGLAPGTLVEPRPAPSSGRAPAVGGGP